MEISHLNIKNDFSLKKNSQKKNKWLYLVTEPLLTTKNRVRYFCFSKCKYVQQVIETEKYYDAPLGCCHHR